MRQVIGWFAFVAVLVGLGVLIYIGAPPTPRWRVRADIGDLDLVRTMLTADGLVVTVRGEADRYGPAEVRDAATGALLRRGWEAGGPEGCVLTGGGRWAVGPDGDSLRWLDTASGRGRQVRLPVPLGGIDHVGAFAHTPDEKLFFAAPPAGPLAVIDAEAGAALATLPGVMPSVVPTGRRLFYASYPRLVVWDIAARRELGGVPSAGGYAVKLDGTRVLVEEESGQVLYDVTDPARPRKLAAVAARNSPVGGFWGELAIVHAWRESAPGALHFLDAATGRTLWQSPPSEWAGSRPLLSPDGHFAAVGGGGVYDLREKRLAWAPAGQSPEFSPDSRSVLCYGDGQLTLDIRDAATGQKQASIPIPPRIRSAGFQTGGRQFWLAAVGEARADVGWLDWLLSWVRPARQANYGLLLGLEWPSQRVLLRVTDRAAMHCHVAPDGSYAITVHGDGIRRYDLPPPKPWAWIVGVPLATGVVLLTVRAWWRRGRRRVPAEGDVRPG
jgi:hypothetical protein